MCVCVYVYAISTHSLFSFPCQEITIVGRNFFFVLAFLSFFLSFLFYSAFKSIGF